MSLRMKKFAFLLGVIILTSCGGGGDNSNKEGAGKSGMPTSKAGNNRQVNTGESVVLDGSLSEDNGSISEYLWSQLAGTEVVLEPVAGKPAAVQFDAPFVVNSETLRFELQVIDDEGNKSSDAVDIDVLGPALPSVNAGDDRRVESLDVVEILPVIDDQGVELTAITWEQIAGPQVDFEVLDKHRLTFTAPDLNTQTTFTFKISFSDSYALTHADEVSISVSPIAAPEINLPAEVKIIELGQVYLDAVVDEDKNKEMHYVWKQISGPGVILTEVENSYIKFQAPGVGEEVELGFQVAVTNKKGKQSVAETLVKIVPSPAPVITFDDPTVKEQEPLTISATITDQDDALNTLGLDWQRLDAGPDLDIIEEGYIIKFTTPAVVEETTLVFELSARDPKDEIGVGKVTVTVLPNLPPVAEAGEKISVYALDTVQLDASQSSDEDTDKQLLSYQWRELTDFEVALSDTSKEKPTFTSPDVEVLTTLRFELTVSDNKGKNNSDTVEVEVKPFEAPHNLQVKRRSRPGRLEITWEESDAAERHDIHIVDLVDATKNIILENQFSPLVLPAALNDYMYHHITVTAVRQNSSRSSAPISTDFNKIVGNGSFFCGERNRGLQCWGRERKFIANDSFAGPHAPEMQNRESWVSSRTGNSACAMDQGQVKCWGQIWVPEDLTNPRLLTASGFPNEYCVIRDEQDEQELYCWSQPVGGRPYHRFRNLDAIFGVDVGNPSHLVVGGNNFCIIDDGQIMCEVWGGNSKVEGVPEGSDHAPEVFIAVRDSMCMLTEGVLQCWGEDNLGIVSEQPTGLSNISQLVASHNHLCVLTNGSVNCWGGEDQGATEVPADLVNVSQLAVGSGYSCALNDEGVRCWGDADEERYPETRRFIDEVLPTLENPRHIASGNNTLCAVDDKGLVCGGGELSREHEFYRTLKQPKQLAYPCALDEGAVVCAEGFAVSEVPNGIVNPKKLYMTEDSVDPRVACVLAESGLHCWGDEESPLLPIPDLTQPKEFMTRGSFACAIDGTQVTCWGTDVTYKRVLDGAEGVPAGLHSLRLGASGIACGLIGKSPYCWGSSPEKAEIDIDDATLLSGSAQVFCADHDGSFICNEHWAHQDQSAPWNTGLPLVDPADDLGFHCSYPFSRDRKCSALAIAEGQLFSWGPNEDSLALQNSLPLVTKPTEILGESCIVDDGAMLCWGTGMTSIDGWRFPAYE